MNVSDGEAHRIAHSPFLEIVREEVVTLLVPTCARRDSNPRPSAPEAVPLSGAPVPDGVLRPEIECEIECDGPPSGAETEGEAHQKVHSPLPAGTLAVGGFHRGGAWWVRGGWNLA